MFVDKQGEFVDVLLESAWIDNAVCLDGSDSIEAFEQENVY
jgi:hypothetical protein